MNKRIRLTMMGGKRHEKTRALLSMIIVIFGVVGLAIGLGMSTRKASAALSENEMYNNLMANTMKKCYTGTEMNSSVDIQSYNSYTKSSYSNNEAKNAFVDLVLAGGNTRLYVPTRIGSGNNLKLLEGNVLQINCSALFLGLNDENGSMAGVFESSGKQIPQPASPYLEDQLDELGYDWKITEADRRKCITAGYTEADVSGTGATPIGSVCWSFKDLDAADAKELSNKANPVNYGGPIEMSFSNQGVNVNLSFKLNNGQSCSGPRLTLPNTDASTAIDKIGEGSCRINNSNGKSYEVNWNVEIVEGEEFTSEVSIQNYGLAYRDARNNLYGNGNMYNFAEQDRFELYKMYLDKVYNVSYGDGCKTRSALDKNGGPIQTDKYGNKIYYVYYNGGYHNVTAPEETKKYGVAIFNDDSTFYLNGHCDGFECLLKQMYKIAMPETETCSSDPNTTPNPSPSIVENADFDCDTILKENGGKVGAMQWILCPALNGSAYTANWIDNLSQSMLEIKTDRYDINSGAFKGWEIMRNIANVAMVIFLSVIIFSQLTGYGIDNYGIKKMLPRLIMMALIINLSFYICELAIDLSNIAGEGLRNMFGAFGNDISQSLSGEQSVGEAGTGFVTSSLVGLFAAFSSSGPAIAAGVAAASLGWVAIVIAALVLVLIIIVAVVTLWLMLGLREIIVRACVILSPLAFACFILPNTQNITKKWWSLFKAAIIVFPICGLVAGVSYLLRGISKSDDGEMGMGIAGRIILFVMPYLVFFLLPMLLKNALAALGKLGGALTSMGQAIRNGGQQIGQAGRAGIQNSQRYKDWSKDRVRRLQQQRADRIMQRYGDGKSLEQRIADARTRANDTNATSGQRRAAQRELQRAEAEQRQFYEAQTTHYNLQSEQALAGTAPEVLATRAESRQEALELKNYSDQYSTYTPAQLSNELNDAVDAYTADRSDSNRVRLQAVMNTIENNNMMSRVMNDDKNKLTSLTFSADNKNDVKLLSQLTGSKDIVASQFGKQMSKPANSDVRDLSMNSFASGTNGKVNLKDAIKGKGSVLVGASDDSLEYIRKHGANAATPDALLNAAGATNEEKELAQIHAMLRSADSNDINLSPEGLAAYGKSTMDELAERAKRDSVFQRKFVAAANQLAKSPELMGKLHENQRGRINEVMKIVNPNDRTFETQTNGNGETFEQGGGI